MELAGGFAQGLEGGELAAGRLFPVLLPQDYPGTGFAKGVGTPFIVEHPETLKKYMLFTGWNTDDGSARGIYRADIDEDYKISNITPLLIPPIVMGDETFVDFPVVHAVYHFATKQWVLFFSYKTQGGSNWYAAYIAFTSDFSERESNCHFLLGPTGDCGFSVYPDFTGMHGLVAIGSYLHYYSCGDVNSYPFGNWTGYGEVVALGFDDVMHHFVQGNKWVVLCENYNAADGTGSWHLRCSIAPNIKSNRLAHIMPATSTQQILPFWCGAFGGIAHPHWTNLLVKPALLFVWFRGCGAGWGSSFENKFRHEIWVYVPSYDPFEIDRLKPFLARPFEADQSGVSKWIPTMGLKADVLYQAGSAGTIYIDEGFDIADLSDAVDGNYYVSTTVNVEGAGAGRHLIENPAQWLRIRLDGFTANTMVYVYLS